MNGLSRLPVDMHEDNVQLRALVAFKEVKSVALLGSAGSGKSFVMKQMLSFARKKYGHLPNSVVPFAYTNIAAREIGGDTLHTTFHILSSWEFTKHTLRDRVFANKEVWDRIKEMKVLVIDEFSKPKGPQLDSIEFILRQIAQSAQASGLPFGGRQVVFAGDPFQFEFQFEPVNLGSAQTAYESRNWRRIFGGVGDGCVTLLTANHRQISDNFFFNCLSRIRLGEHTESDISDSNATSIHLLNSPRSHVRLCLKKAEVQSSNEGRLDPLRSRLVILKAKDTFSPELSSSEQCEAQKKMKQMAPLFVRLKQGAAVMLTGNINDLLPGAQCVVMKIYRTRERGFYAIYVLSRGKILLDP